MIAPAGPAPDKTTLRREALARRAGLVEADRNSAAALLAQAKLPFTLPALIAGYAPMRGELDVTTLLARLERDGARLCLPAVVSTNAPLVFREWHTGATLVPGRLGTLEPDPAKPLVIPDILLVPLAAFDRAGHRLGYGGGYYDRTLAALRAARPVIAIGVAFAVQEVEPGFAEPHDARLDFVLTERELIDCRAGQG